MNSTCVRSSNKPVRSSPGCHAPAPAGYSPAARLCRATTARKSSSHGVVSTVRVDYRLDGDDAAHPRVQED